MNSSSGAFGNAARKRASATDHVLVVESIVVVADAEATATMEMTDGANSNNTHLNSGPNLIHLKFLLVEGIRVFGKCPSARPPPPLRHLFPRFIGSKHVWRLVALVRILRVSRA